MDAVIKPITWSLDLLSSLMFEKGEPRLIDYIALVALCIGTLSSVVLFIAIVLI